MKINKCDFCEHSVKTIFGLKCPFDACARSQESIDTTVERVVNYYKYKEASK